MNASTIATAIAALDDARLQLRRLQEVWSGNSIRYDKYKTEIDEIDAAIADLEALQADSAAAPPSVAMSALDMILQKEREDLKAYLDELQRRPEQDSITGDDK